MAKMFVPGVDLLRIASRVIAHQTIIYYRANGRTLNAIGQDVTAFLPGEPIIGSFQPVPRSLYYQYGLDLQKSYYTFYSNHNILDIARDITADQIAFNGQRFAVESANDWRAIDGWKGVLCVMIKEYTNDQQVFGFNAIPSENENENFGNGNFINYDG